MYYPEWLDPPDALDPKYRDQGWVWVDEYEEDQEEENEDDETNSSMAQKTKCLSKWH